MKKTSKTLVLAMGTTLITGLTSVAVGAEAIDMQGGAFEMKELSSGYMQLAAADTAAKPKTMEGKCAGAKPMSAPKVAEAKCGEGKCGDAMQHKAATGAAKPAAESAKSAVDGAKATATDAGTKTTEGKCGEGKCGGTMKKAADDSAVKK